MTNMPVQAKIDFTPLVISSTKWAEKISYLLFGKFIEWGETRKAYMAAQRDKNVQAIKNGELLYEDGCLYAPLPEPQAQSLPDMLAFHARWQELDNLIGCVHSAVTQLSQISESPNSDIKINPDWFTRWRREASAVSNEDLQNMWGRILAEEIQKAGTISLRTLDILKNITADEAKLFVQLSTFVVNGVLICSEHRFPPLCKLDDILDLIDAGLLTNAEIVRHHGIQDVTGFRRFEGAGYWLYIQCPRKINPVSGMALSKAGMEIIKIADRQNARREEITKICDTIRSGANEKITSMKAVLPGSPYAAPEGSILYRYPYISSRKKRSASH